MKKAQPVTGPILFTPRLILRPVAAEDLAPWIAFHEDEQTMRFLGGVQPPSIAWRGLCTMAGAWSIRGFSMFSLIERDTGRWIGRAGPWCPEGWPGNEIAWGLAREFAGRGFAHEAAIASIDYAIELLGWEEVIHTISPDNAPSIALARKLGATNRGPTRLPPPHGTNPIDAWGQSADDWRAGRASR